MTVEPLTIGPLTLATNLWLAPLAGYCDLAFRLVARSCGGVGLATTALLCPKGILHMTRKTAQLVATNADDFPLAMQFYGSDPAELAECCRWAEDNGAAAVDFNLGCPVPKVTSRNGGSKLLCDPDLAVRLAARMAGNLRCIPLTAKLRLGWDDANIVAPQLARRLEDVGVAAITIHGRTAEMQFAGRCRLDGIAEVVSAVRKIPVIGNGNVDSPADAAEMIRRTGCRGVMIGRAALSAPWIFRDTWNCLTTGQTPRPPSLEQKCQLMRQHFAHMVDFRGERIAVLEFRKIVSWYGRHMHPCRMLREQMRKLESAAHFERILGQFLDWRHQLDADFAATEPADRAAAEPADRDVAPDAA